MDVKLTTRTSSSWHCSLGREGGRGRQMKSIGNHYKVLINNLKVVVTMDTKHLALLLSYMILQTTRQYLQSHHELVAVRTNQKRE